MAIFALLKQISGLNFRIARAVKGAADELVAKVVAGGQLHNTLLVSPPGCGKTTLLRDLIRQLSEGVPGLQFTGVNVGVVDERSELAGCVSGVPQLDVGCRTDVLDGCPKSEGIRMLIRSMTPQVVAADEIGSIADVQALEEALQSGVHILTTAHGDGGGFITASGFGAFAAARLFFLGGFFALARRKGCVTV